MVFPAKDALFLSLPFFSETQVYILGKRMWAMLLGFCSGRGTDLDFH